MSKPSPFTVAISDETLSGIYERVASYRWHEMPDIEDGQDRWAYGTDMTYLKELCAYWVKDYDWRRGEALLNRFSHYHAPVDGTDIHYILEPGSGDDPRPLIITHGWPGSVFEFAGVIEQLAHPERFGGRAEDGLTVVAPSLPGYGFSAKPPRPVGPRHTAQLWDKLMREALEFDRYTAQGGDWGSIVSSWLGYEHDPEHGGGCEAIHLNMYSLRPHGVSPETDEERQWAEKAALTLQMEGAYLQLQMTKPQTLSYGMMDSPVGVAAWIIEKFNTWSDTRGDDGKSFIENAYSKDALLDNIMVYLVTETFNTATWFYRGMMEEGGVTMADGQRVTVPTGVAYFPYEFITFPPRRMMEAGYNITRWTEFDRGGHFAAMETGSLFAGDVLAFARELS
ncbi:MAG: epoxide hydrolase family protein [Parvularculales bacterium]